MFFQCECRTLASSFYQNYVCCRPVLRVSASYQPVGAPAFVLGSRGHSLETPRRLYDKRQKHRFFCTIWAHGPRRLAPNYPVPVSLSYTTLTSHLLNYILPVSYIKTISIEIKYIYYFLLCFNAKKMTRTCNLTSTTVLAAYEPWITMNRWTWPFSLTPP